MTKQEANEVDFILLDVLLTIAEKEVRARNFSRADEIKITIDQLWAQIKARNNYNEE